MFFRSLLVLLCSLCSGLCQAALLDVQISKDRVVIRAEDADLKEILQVISMKTGMQVSYFEPGTTELISCTIDEPTMANSLSSLLQNWNYSLVFGENRQEPLVPKSLWLVSKVADEPHPTTIQASIDTVVNPDNHIQPLQSSVFARLFKDELVRAKMMEVKTVERTSGQSGGASLNLPPVQTGIQITKLASDSAFIKIGLHAGDIIYDVNGTPVKSVKELVNSMKVPDNQSIIRIERYKNDETIDPIYIELH